MENDEKKVYFLVNEEGEIVREISSSNVDRLTNNDIYIRRDSHEGNDPIEKIKINYLKFNKEVALELHQNCPQFFMLLPFINYKENALRFPNGTYITPTNFARYLGMSEIYMMRVFNKLKKLKILSTIRKDNKNIYVVNPYIALCGAGVRKTTKNKFLKTEWEFYKLRKGQDNGEKSSKQE